MPTRVLQSEQRFFLDGLEPGVGDDDSGDELGDVDTGELLGPASVFFELLVFEVLLGIEIGMLGVDDEGVMVFFSSEAEVTVDADATDVDVEDEAVVFNFC